MLRMETLMRLDARISDVLRLRAENPVWNRIFSFFAHSGDSWFWLGGLGLVWLFGNTFWHNWAAFIGVVMVFEAAVVLFMKFTIRRRRPEGEWGQIYRKSDPHSFPSGHASRAGLMLALALGLGPAWFAWTIVIWAPLVCLARVVMGVHYISDVVAGMLIGAAVGLVSLQMQGWIMALPLIFR